MEEGNLPGASKLCDESLSMSDTISSSGPENRTRLMLSRLAIERGQPAEAEKLAREVLDRYLREQDPAAQAVAYEALARPIWRSRGFREARDAVEHSLALVGQNVLTRLSVVTTQARAHDPRARPEAIEQLQAAIDEAQRAGLVRLALEARLALADVEIRSGMGRSGGCISRAWNGRPHGTDSGSSRARPARRAPRWTASRPSNRCRSRAAHEGKTAQKNLKPGLIPTTAKESASDGRHGARARRSNEAGTRSIDRFT